MSEASVAPAKIVTACIVVIGNEILSGRTKDANIPYLAAELGKLGVRVMECRVIPDIEETIVAAINEVRAKFDYVFTQAASARPTTTSPPTASPGRSASGSPSIPRRWRA